MRYPLRIVVMIAGVIVLSAGLAGVINHFQVKYGVLLDVDGIGMFVGLMTSGFTAAILSRDFWLAAG